MSFVPLHGPARWSPGDPLRESRVEFTGRRTVELPLQGAIPVLTRALRADDAHPSVTLLSAATMLAMTFVAAGRTRPTESGAGTRIGPLGSDDQRRVRDLAAARAYDGLAAPDAEVVVREVLDAVADVLARPAATRTPSRDPVTEPSVGRGGPSGGPSRDPVTSVEPSVGRGGPSGGPSRDPVTSAEPSVGRGGPSGGPSRDPVTSVEPSVGRGGPSGGPSRDPVTSAEPGGDGVLDLTGSRDGPDGPPRPTSGRARPLATKPPMLLGISLRVEAPDEVLVGGRLMVVPQVHEAENPGHVATAAELWHDEEVLADFGVGARLRTLLALRRAAEVWPPLGRLLDGPVPEQVELEAEEVGDLLERGLAALSAIDVEVFWPRSLRRDLTGRATVEKTPRPMDRSEPLQSGLLGHDAVFAFDWRAALDGADLTDEEMDTLSRAVSPVIRLRDSWLVVDPATARRARRRMRSGPRELEVVEALRASLTGVIDMDGVTHEVHPGATLEKLRDRVAHATSVPAMPEPAALQATLRDYQRRGLAWLAELTGLGLGCCLADDMGLGKTITVIALYLHRQERGLATGPTLVVCPASLMGNWEAELRRFAPEVVVRRFHGAVRDLKGLGGPEGGVVLTTYQTMRVDHERLAAVGWDLVVADEAQHVKNARSTTARHLRAIGSTCRVALTGTPVENDLTELWAILDWAVPGLLGSRNAFRKVWAAPIESGGDPAVARRFAQLVSPFLLRRRKSDPGIAPELPDKTETDQVVGLTGEQTVLYESLVRVSMEKIEQAPEEVRRGLVLSMLTGLKQICNHPAHYLKQTTGTLRGRSHKLDVLDELLDVILAEGGAVLVFTQYVTMGHLLERHLASRGIGTLFLHGSVPVAQREQMVAAFQAGQAPVFLLSLKAGGTGLNLTRADHVVHVDRWWNPAVEDQATDRAHRIGQTRPVQVHRLVTEGTIEERVGQLLARKRSVAEAVLGRGEAALTELGVEELRDLVSLRPRDG